jgi:hypothetical protein
MAAIGSGALAVFAPPAPPDREALQGEALELIVRELKKAPPAGREGLLKLLDLLIR